MAAIGTYLQESACEHVEHRKAATLAVLEAELRVIAAIFNVSERADSVMLNIHTSFELARNISRHATKIGTPLGNARALKMLWLDSWGVENILAGACCGAPALIMQVSMS